MSNVLMSAEGKMVRPWKGERPWINTYHNKWSVLGYEWLPHRNRWSRAPRMHMSAAFADVFEVSR
jgi:hypothetical protein